MGDGMSARLEIRWEGERVKQATSDAAGDAIGQIAEKTAEIARSLVPVRTGQLRDSIGAVSTGKGGLEWALIASTPYALYVELGTSRQPAQPYMRPAVELVMREVPRIVASVASSFGKGGFGGLVRLRRNRL